MKGNILLIKEKTSALLVDGNPKDRNRKWGWNIVEIEIGIYLILSKTLYVIEAYKDNEIFEISFDEKIMEIN